MQFGSAQGESVPISGLMRVLRTSPSGAAGLALLAAVMTATMIATMAGAPSFAQAPATIAEADGKGKVDVNIYYYADMGCTTFADVREGPPANIEAPQRTLVVTVTLDRKQGECVERPYTIERKISIADRAEALSVDIFYVDPDGRFVRSQRPRIYRDRGDCEVAANATKTC